MEREPKDKAKEKDYQVYRKPDTVPSCDKGDHKSRSLANSPVHQEHWAKEEKKKGSG